MNRLITIGALGHGKVIENMAGDKVLTIGNVEIRENTKQT